MKVPYRVRRVFLEMLSPDCLRLDLIGVAHCEIDGVPNVVAVQIIRVSQTVLKCAFTAPFDALQIPECLQDPEIRKDIEGRVLEQIAEMMTCRMAGGSGIAKITFVKVSSTSPDLHARGIVGAAQVGIAGESSPITLLLMVGDRDRLHITYCINFTNFQIPPSLEYPAVRAEIRQAICREIESLPGYGEATAP